VKDRPFFAQRINATRRLQAHPFQKVVAAFRVIAYGEAPDRPDAYVRLFASTIAMTRRESMRFIVHYLGSSYLRPPTPEELQRILRASPPMEPTVQPNGHVCTTCGAVTGSPSAERKL